MKKSNITFLLTMLMSMVGLNASAHNIEVKNADGVTIYYNYINKGTELAVTYRGSSYSSYLNEYTGNVVIPESVTYNEKTYSVTSIGNSAFYYCSGLTSVTIPNSVTSIGESAFYGCSGLKKVIVSDIAKWCFISFDDFSANPLDYAHHLYSDENTEIKELIIPNSVTSIENYAFEGCSGLTSVTIPNSVTSIGSKAFRDCSGLTSVTIPNSVTSIGSEAFSGCSGLNKVIVSDIGKWCAIIFIDSYANPLSYAKHLYSDENTEINNLTIPNNVTSIGKYAFEGCSGLTSVTIPNSVTSIGYDAFYGCSGLTSITIPKSVTSIGSEAFRGCSGLTSVTLESNTIVSKKYTYESNLTTVFGNQIKKLTIGNDVTSIGNSAFRGCSGLTSVTIPNSVTSIRSSAFEGCSGLTSIDIPNSVTSIGGGAFWGCSKLTSITIPNSVTIIGNYAFRDCSALTSVTIPNSVTSIDYDAFYGCTKLKKVIAPDIAKWCSIFFAISANPLTYAHHLYSDENTEIKELTIPNSVTSIRSSAFEGCSGLTSITIGSGVTSIGSYAFEGCSGLTSITIGSGVTSIGSYAFSGCSGLTSITIPNSVTSIGSEAFYGCSGLTSITIPNSVTSIGQNAFCRCENIREVYALTEFPAYVKIGTDAFPKSENNYRSTLYVKKGLKDLFSKADGWSKFVDIREMTDEKYKELMEEASKEQGGEQEEPTISVTVNLSSAGYATFYNDSYNFKLPAGVSALVLTSESGLTLNYKTIASGDANGIIPKGVAVIIVSNNRKGGTYTLTSTTESASYSGTNLLHGSSLQTMTSNVNGVSTSGNSSYVYYKLAYGKSGSVNANKLGWYWGANNGAAFTIAGGKAWLALPKTSAQSLSDVLFIDDDATSIEGVEQSEMKGAIDAQYNMAGQRVGNGYNGIIIVNGKKVIR